MADELSTAFKKVSVFFKIRELNDNQKLSISKIVKERKDVFVNLPTGYGKSLIFQSLPLVFDELTGESGHIIIVISPLLTLIDDQIQCLRTLGLSCVSLSHIETEEERKEVEKGSYAIVYATPEGLLKNERWRQMLKSEPYKKKLCAVAVDEAHVIKQWGTSSSAKMAPFRECYGRLNELRSLAPPVNILAVTATATKKTKDAIVDVLRMKDPFEISESPEKTNVTYVVETIPKGVSLQQCFSWLADEVKVKGVDSERTIIYCQTINQCGQIYSTLKAMLGDSFFSGTIGDRRNVILEMLHSCSPSANKEAVLRSFTVASGSIRILVATIAFGMGVDCKGVHRTIHFGPSKNLESFVQETGRAGRDGQQSTSYLLYNGLLLTHVEKDIKDYINNNHECRRKTLLKQFTTMSKNLPVVPHLCCDNCARHCKCALQQCKKPGVIAKPSVKPNSKEREATKSQEDALRQLLILYHKSLVMMFMGQHAHGEIKYFTNLHLLIGFSDLQIRQVMENYTKLFTINDICDHVEIWHLDHAYQIHNILSQVFGDVPMDKELENWFNDESEIEDEIVNALGEWNPLVEDDDFLDLILENLSMSLLSVNEESNTSLGGDVPDAVLEVLENFSFKET